MPKTNFDPATNGFSFINYWTFDDTERVKLSALFTGAIDDALAVLSPWFNSAFIAAGLNRRLTAWCANALPESYGLCGGMAFAALDYYDARLSFPPSQDVPTRDTAGGTTLRDYLEQRQIESLRANLPTVLAWMAVLNLIPQWWAFQSGGMWLLQRSKEQWEQLKRSIDAGTPQPLALVGTTSNPSENHQVLATGYDEQFDGTGVIYVYDMNCPRAEQTIRLDFHGSALQAVESCPSDGRGPLRGFICEKYQSILPPTVMDWTLPRPHNV
jgi:hypothetical protein